MVHPVVLGDGVPLFHGLTAELPLRLVRARTLDCGVVLLQHARDRSPPGT